MPNPDDFDFATYWCVVKSHYRVRRYADQHVPLIGHDHRVPEPRRVIELSAHMICGQPTSRAHLEVVAA